MPASVQVPHHPPEFLDLTTGAGTRRVLGVRREEPNGVVTPVVGQALIDEGRVVGEMMHRHQFDRPAISH
jgi:hypothetical protein